MLWDRKWDKPPVESLAGLIAWLEQQPVDGEYQWYSAVDCLVCRYLRAVTGEPWPHQKWAYSAIFDSPHDYNEVAATRPWTYGAALERARAVASHAMAPNVGATRSSE